MMIKKLQWKEFGVDLGLAIEHCKTLTSKIVSYSADYVLGLNLSEALTQEEDEAIQEYWDDLTEEHEHCENYKSFEERLELAETRKSNIKEVKLAMVEKTWASMNSAERKLCMGLDEEVSDSELSDLLAE